MQNVGSLGEVPVGEGDLYLFHNAIKEKIENHIHKYIARNIVIQEAQILLNE